MSATQLQLSTERVNELVRLLTDSLVHLKDLDGTAIVTSGYSWARGRRLTLCSPGGEGDQPEGMDSLGLEPGCCTCRAVQCEHPFRDMTRA